MVELRRFQQVDSTNRIIKDAIRAGHLEGLVAVARVQTGGYGRQGRAWASPAGGLYLSVLLRPPQRADLSSLSLVIGLAVRHAIADMLPSPAAAYVRVKWPNDVVLMPHNDASRDQRASHASSSQPAFQKLAGISLEALEGALCAGMGVNVYPPTAALQVEGKNRPAYLADLMSNAPVQHEELLDELQQGILAHFAPLYQIWCAQGLEPLLSAFNDHAALTGQAVAVRLMDGSQLVSGTVLGVNERGELLVATAGKVKAIASGEAHILPAERGLK